MENHRKKIKTIAKKVYQAYLGQCCPTINRLIQMRLKQINAFKIAFPQIQPIDFRKGQKRFHRTAKIVERGRFGH